MLYLEFAIFVFFFMFDQIDFGKCTASDEIGDVPVFVVHVFAPLGIELIVVVHAALHVFGFEK